MLETVVNLNPYLSTLLIIVDSHPPYRLVTNSLLFHSKHLNLNQFEVRKTRKNPVISAGPKTACNSRDFNVTNKKTHEQVSPIKLIFTTALTNPPEDLNCWKSPFQEPYLARTGPNRRRTKTNLNLTSFSCRLGRWRWCPAWLG